MQTLHWSGDVHGDLRLIDQTKLPLELIEITCHDVATVWEAIKVLRVRGAPAIGVAAAYGVCVGAKNFTGHDAAALRQHLHGVCDYLASSRPTAVNLFWALDRMRRTLDALPDSYTVAQIQQALLQEAQRVQTEDQEICRTIGRHGAALLKSGDSVLTHCNAGGLATADYGTALALFFTAQEQGKQLHVFADETRPLLQGARLTAWELQQRGIDCTLICDSMAAQVMKEGRVQAVVVGADRIAANGDAANKIGTYGVAVAAHAHNIPFYVAAPVSTFDLTLPTGDLIPIEERAAEEITDGFGRRTAPPGIRVYNPAFDVTPARLIRGIVTERGIIQPVTREEVQRIVGGR